MQFKTIGKIHNKKVLAKAEQLLIDLANGVDIFVKTLKINANQRGGDFLKSITVSYSYRLLLKGGKWLLMTHERYNKEIRI